MSGSSSHVDDGKKKARIEIIPLIDVIFFLLATFVLFTLSLNRIQSIDVQLPKAVESKGKPDEDIVTLQVSDTNTYYWKVGTGSSELISKDDIVPRLQQLRSQSANARVLIAGDNMAKFGPTVLALDEVRKAGIAQVSVETRVRPTGK
ncbi:MAG TPA: biopolymer transporter ExbD [Opitutaceae bacterium]|nr:biopolymer transporter ExbD [Opitutaceae bacterium]